MLALQLARLEVVLVLVLAPGLEQVPTWDTVPLVLITLERQQARMVPQLQAGPMVHLDLDLCPTCEAALMHYDEVAPELVASLLALEVAAVSLLLLLQHLGVPCRQA